MGRMSEVFRIAASVGRHARWLVERNDDGELRNLRDSFLSIRGAGRENGGPVVLAMLLGGAISGGAIGGALDFKREAKKAARAEYQISKIDGCIERGGAPTVCWVEEAGGAVVVALNRTWEKKAFVSSAAYGSAGMFLFGTCVLFAKGVSKAREQQPRP